MDMFELVNIAKSMMPKLLSSYCFVNNTILPLTEVDQMGYDEFALHSKLNMPSKLYRYFPNTETCLENETKVNYSHISLRDNTVFMQAPSNFDDVYDSDINIDFMMFQKYRLLEYCKRCGLNMDENSTIQELGNSFIRMIIEAYYKYQDYEHYFVKKPESELEKMANEHFILSLKLQLLKDNDLGRIVPRIITKEYEDFIKKLKNTFRVACFTTNPFSQLMWGGAYANYHNGFCVEYEVLPNDENYHQVYYNMFPLIYCKERPDVSKYLISQIDNEPDIETLWKIYSQGALRKSLEWMYQCEWRLLLPMNSKSTNDYNVKFFPITKVFLGNRMSTAKRREIINICKSKNIPYIGVRRNSYKFEMEPCDVICENCMCYKNS